MRTAAGILGLVGGVIFPIAMVVWLSMRLNRRPALRLPQAVLALALNAALPAALITSGLALLLPHLWAVAALRYAVEAAWAAAGAILIALAVMRLAGRTAEKRQGEGRADGG
ncbi:MAG: hypothetical protein BWY52_02611 [Chloroflexi bacterium ADurb.Bin325]|nr:MAG: hypothetical protein BWY52_02611 [Chloroflexi bacterium ADurb.Bin325]